MGTRRGHESEAARPPDPRSRAAAWSDAHETEQRGAGPGDQKKHYVYVRKSSAEISSWRNFCCRF